MKVILYQVVVPQDRSPILPLGVYEVESLTWISSVAWDLDNEEDVPGGLATFVVTSGEFASEKRRIGVVVEEESERLVIIAGFGLEEFQRAARLATVDGLKKAKALFEEILSRNANDSRATRGITFIDRLLTEKGKMNMDKMTVEVGQLFKDKDPRRDEPRILKVLSIAVGKCELAPTAGGRNTKMTIANLLRRYEYVPSDSTPANIAETAEQGPTPQIGE